MCQTHLFIHVQVQMTSYRTDYPGMSSSQLLAANKCLQPSISICQQTRRGIRCQGASCNFLPYDDIQKNIISGDSKGTYIIY